MRTDCESAVAKALGRPLKAGEAREIDDAVRLQMRLLARKDPQAWMALPPIDRLQRAAEAAAKAIVAEVRLKQRRVQLQIAAHDRIEDILSRAFDQVDRAGGKPGEKLNAVSQLLAFDPVGRNIPSVETAAHSIANQALGNLTTLWQSVKGFAHLFEAHKGVSDLVHELFGEHTGNAAAREGARAWLRVTDELRDRANAAGMDVGKLEEWHYPQSHSQARIAAAALEKWTADTLPLLDRSKYLNADGSRFSDDQMREFLRHAFDSIVTDGQNKVRNEYNPERGTLQQSYGIGAIADRQGAHRAIFFKDADAYLTYQGLYGERSLWSTLTGHVRAIARDIALVETLGPNAEQTFRYFNERTLTDELRASPAAASKIRSQAALNESMFDYVSGKRAVVNDKIAAIGQAWRNFETATKLGRVVITAIGDEAGMAATAFANHVPYSEVLLRELHYLNPANGESREIAAHAGLGINSMIGGLNRFGYEDLQLAGGEGKAAGVRNFTSKLATGVLQASGAETMWDARRRALGSVLMSYLGKWTREVEHFADINPQDHGILASKGITEADWQVWRRAELEDWGMKHGVLTPKSIWAIPDEKIDEVIAPQIEKIRESARAQIEELRARNAQGSAWIANRTAKLGEWIERTRSRLADRAAKDDEAAQQVVRKLTALYDSLDTVNSYFKGQRENALDLDELRRAGVGEGRNQAAMNEVAQRLKQTMRDTARIKAELEGAFKERFAAEEQRIDRLIESGDEGQVAYALDRFNKLFDEAHAQLTDRLQGADQRLTDRINDSVAKVQELRGRIAEADRLWQRANAARPNFRALREQGVREGRARQSITELRARLRELRRATDLKEQSAEFQRELAERQEELEEYVQRAQQIMTARQQVIERIQRDLEPQVQAARLAARRHASTALLGHILEETGMGVMDTGARERARMLFGTTAGTAAGELARSVFLFKSFSFSMMMKHWARAAAMPTGAATAAYVARLIVGGTILGAIANQLRNVASGKNPSNIAEPQFWGESFLRGGGLGFYGDFLYDELTSHDTSLIPALMGPLATNAEELWNLTGAAAFKHARGERTDEGAKVIRFLRGNVPFLNMWYTQAAFDHLIWNEMQEAASPGYLERMQAKAYATRGTSWWWNPAEATPASAPDLGKAWQPELGQRQLQVIADRLAQETGEQ